METQARMSHIPCALRRGALALLLPVFLAGCAEDAVSVYEVPVQKQRLVGAIVLVKNNAWFFKLMGNASDVQANREAFFAFVRSLRFPADGAEPVTWKLPEGWKVEMASGMRYASLYIPRGQVVTVSKLGAEGGGGVANINRWREQLKLPPADRDFFDKCERLKLEDGLEALVVDMESARVVPEMEFSAEDLNPHKEMGTGPAEKGLDYQLPPGWKEVAERGIAAAKFRIEQDGQTAEMTITPLGGPAGGTVSNVNRWRQQVGLNEATEEQIKKESQQLEVAGEKCVYVNLVGPEGGKRQRMLAVICPRGEQTWFLKMMGPADAVAKQQQAFEAFAKSLKFGGK